MDECVLHDAFGPDTQSLVGLGRFVKQGAGRIFLRAHGAGGSFGNVLDAHGTGNILVAGVPASSILEFIPELEEEDVVTPISHFLLKVLGAAVDAAETLESAEPLQFGLVFFGYPLHRAR